MTKTEAAPIDGEVVNDSEQPAETSRAVAAPRQRSRAVAAGGNTPPDPMELYKIALQKGASVEVMSQLLQLQEKVEANTARKAFNAAISAARAEMPVIVKNARVQYEGKQSNGKVDYAHETLAQIAEQIDPILARHGLSYRFRPSQPAAGQLSVTCVISHELGHSEENTMTAGVDGGAGKNHLQAIGSATTYLSRYTLKAGLGLSAAEVDDDGNSSPSPKPSVPRASQQASNGGGDGTATQQQADPGGKTKPHTLTPLANEKFSQWSLRYIAAFKTADNPAELSQWDKANDALLDMIYNKERSIYDEINRAYKHHLAAVTPQQSRPNPDNITSGPQTQTDQQQAEKPAATRWTSPDPIKEYESFLDWAADKLRSWSEDVDSLEWFWNTMIEPAKLMPPDHEELMGEYRRAEAKLAA